MRIHQPTIFAYVAAVYIDKFKGWMVDEELRSGGAVETDRQPCKNEVNFSKALL